MSPAERANFLAPAKEMMESFGERVESMVSTRLARVEDRLNEHEQRLSRLEGRARARIGNVVPFPVVSKPPRPVNRQPRRVRLSGNVVALHPKA